MIVLICNQGILPYINAKQYVESGFLKAIRHTATSTEQIKNIICLRRHLLSTVYSKMIPILYRNQPAREVLNIKDT